MTKVVLIYPPIIFGKKIRFGFPPLGILYIATFLQKKGVYVKVIDSFIEGHSLQELTEKILNEKPDIVGFSAMTCQVDAILDAAKILKRKDPALKIVVGGPHISSTKEELFKFTKEIDFLFYGESEKTFYDFVRALEENIPFNSINGLIYKKGSGQIVINNPPKPIQDLDTLPFPDISLINIKKYEGYYAKSLPLTTIIMSRGCPFSCTFCDAHVTHGKRLRLRSPKNIVDEIEHNYKQYKVKQFMIKDSTFTINKKWVYEICSEINKRLLKINWTCNTRVDMVDEELLKVMKNSGCHTVLFGIESGSQKILNKLKKGITLDQIRKGVSLCQKVGLETIGYFMIGNPEEKEEDAQESIKLSKELGLDLVTFGVTVAYPGTEIYNWALKNNALPDKFWYIKKDGVKVSNPTREVNGNLNLKGFSSEKQHDLVKKANKGFYFRPSYIFKQLTKIRKIDDFKRAVKSLKELL